MNYAIFGVMAGIALLTTTIVSVLPVQRALAVCTSNPSTSLKIACANDGRTLGGVLGAFVSGGQRGIAVAGNSLIGAGHACVTGFANFPVNTCVP